MARSLASKPNVDAPGGNYPYGRVRNNPGDNTGTNADENLFGDLIQFFERLMALGGVSANGQPENSSSGFQYVTALLNTVLNTIGMGASNAIDYSGDLFSLTQPGHYFAELAASNKPVSTTGDVIFFKMSVNEQFLIFLSSNGKFYYNTKTGGSWLGWICLNDVASNKVDKGGDSMSGALAMGGNKITGLAAGTGNGDALRYEQVIGLYLLLTGGNLSGSLGMGGNKITNLAPATTNGDAVRFEQLPPFTSIIVDIGDWDMDSNATTTVSLPISYTKIRRISVTVRDDSDSVKYDLFGAASSGTPVAPQGGAEISNIVTPANTVTLSRANGGYFDNTNFNATSFNRGWIVIDYIP